MTNYATKNNRADIVKTNHLSEGLPPMGMSRRLQTVTFSPSVYRLRYWQRRRHWLASMLNSTNPSSNPIG
jgi:hypothetical protein